MEDLLLREFLVTCRLVGILDHNHHFWWLEHPILKLTPKLANMGTHSYIYCIHFRHKLGDVEIVEFGTFSIKIHLLIMEVG